MVQHAPSGVSLFHPGHSYTCLCKPLWDPFPPRLLHLMLQPLFQSSVQYVKWSLCRCSIMKISNYSSACFPWCLAANLFFALLLLSHTVKLQHCSSPIIFFPVIFEPISLESERFKSLSSSTSNLCSWNSPPPCLHLISVRAPSSSSPTQASVSVMVNSSK